jgi:Mn-dependent DtxR family transcriptional regulator
MITAAAYAFDGRSRPTHAELARRFGVSRSAVSHRLSRFKEQLAADQLNRYLALTKRGRKQRVVPMQLNFADEV